MGRVTLLAGVGGLVLTRWVGHRQGARRCERNRAPDGPPRGIARSPFMPSDAIHITSLRNAMAHTRVPAEARRVVARAEGAAKLGAMWVDLPYLAHFNEEIARFFLRAAPRPSRWGTRLHEDRPVAFLRAVIRRAGGSGDGSARGSESES